MGRGVTTVEQHIASIDAIAATSLPIVRSSNCLARAVVAVAMLTPP